MNLRLYEISHLSGLFQIFLERTGKTRRVLEALFQQCADPMENRAALGGLLVADRDDVLKHLPRTVEIEYAFGLLPAYVEADLVHHFSRERVYPGSIPALIALKRSPAISFKSALAIWLRAEFCVQTKSTIVLTLMHLNLRYSR